MTNPGKILEQNVRLSVVGQDIYYLRLKDSPSSFGQDSSFVRFTNNNPYDCLCFYSGKLFPLELKTTSGFSFSIQRSKQDPKKMIKHNQIVGLTEAARHNNVYAGFFLNFEKDAEAYWLSIDEFNNYLANTDKKSINKNDVLSCNPILIESRKLKVNYRYNIKNLFDNIIERKG